MEEEGRGRDGEAEGGGEGRGRGGEGGDLATHPDQATDILCASDPVSGDLYQYPARVSVAEGHFSRRSGRRYVSREGGKGGRRGRAGKERREGW